MRGPFHHFGPQDTIDWFAARGVELKTEADGRMFPTTDDSQTIIDALRGAADAAGVVLRSSSAVESIQHDEQFVLQLKDGTQLHADRVLLATGSSPRGHRLAQQLGHSIVAPVPSLFTCNINEQWLHDLAGTSVPLAQVKLLDLAEPVHTEGPLLITHWGLSGPAVLRASAWGARLLHAVDYRCRLEVDWLGDGTAEQTVTTLRQQHGGKQISNAPAPGALTKRLWTALIDRAGIDPQRVLSQLRRQEHLALVEQLGACPFDMVGKSTFKEEFVTAGGVCRDEIHWRRMESSIRPGLFFAGECLDVDAITGGFNFQHAWTSGYLAGQAMADR